MGVSVIGLSIDSVDAAALAQFWAQVFARPVAANPTAESAVVEGNDTTTGPRLAFHQVPESKSLKNRLHLDLITPDFEAETERLLALDATSAHHVEQNGARWTTFLDPEGNEFDLVAGTSNGGAPSHPSWYHNLITHPDVRLQDGAQVHSLRAREVLGQEKAEAWKLAESRWPHFPEYRAEAGREIPILLLEPAKPTP
jgi:deazaflavin-dependent oxidoreductase (nitroreductase family)